MIEISRRDLILGAATSAAVFGLPGHLAFIGAAEARPLPEAGKGFHSLKVGNAELITLYDGIWRKKHDEKFIKGATVDETKAALRKAGLVDEYVPITFTVPVVKIGGKTIMFDAGTGAQLAPTAGLLAANMKAAGIDPAKIDMIVVTHFHPDHIFGLMAKGTNAQIYPNAEIVVPAAEYAWWTDEGNTSKLPKGRQGLAKRIQATFPKWKNVRRLDAGKDIVPGLKLVSAHGHTPGHSAVQIDAGGKSMMILADTSNIPALFVAHPGWAAAFDMNAAQAEATRRKLFDQAVADKSILTGYHFGFPASGTIQKDGKGYAFVPAA
ncbi:MAG: MBL fold metallo-hydrolase [Hyphomicrobiaceae bacterium]|nr:MBL fold metallo-hydrolase [Hyphomicrobiaceae bacterium]